MFSSFFNAGKPTYEIEQSLRFDGSSRFNKTFASSGNRKTFTISFWVKNTTTTIGNVFVQARTNLRLNTTNAAFIVNAGYGGTNNFLISNASFRDSSAWYHFVLAFDTTQSTASDRVKVWVNNQLQTYSSASYPPQNQDLDYNSTEVAYIGAENTSEYLNGYLAEYHSIDGSALTPTDFAEPDDNGVWRPIRYTGSHGTNGFYLTFDPSATNGIGHDHSGNGNNFTPTGFDTTNSTASTYDVMSDTPTTNWCTLNPLFNNGTEGPGTLSEGNLRHTSDNNYAMCPGTMSLRNGKYYWEAQPITIGTSIVGIIRGTNPGENTYVGYDSNGNVFGFGYQNIGIIYGAAGTGTTSGATLSTGQANFTTSDVIGIAVDIPNGTLDWYINGTLAYAVTGINDDDWFPAVSSYTSDTWEVNFGQRAFAYTPPTGFKPLNTSNLSAPTVKDGSKNFNTVLYTGNGSTQSITGVGFNPDLVWCKSRNSNYHGALVDQVRGATKYLYSSLTIAEETQTTALSTFDSDGFSLNGSFSNVNNNGTTYAAWCWDAGGSGSSIAAGSIDGTNPTIAHTVSANPSAGFSIVSYQSQTSTKPITLGHGLGVKPSMIICKNRDSASSWTVYHSELGATKGIFLNLTITPVTSVDYWNNTEPTSTVFTVNDSTGTHAYGTSNDMIAYCFAEVEGYSKFGSYVGNGSTTGDGPFIWCGFTPRWILIKWYKDVNSAESWHIYDTARQTYNATNTILQPDSPGIEETPSDRYIDILSNGFKLRQNGQQINRSGASYIFAAFAEHPTGGSGVSPATAR